jgi:hypothetical protein
MSFWFRRIIRALGLVGAAATIQLALAQEVRRALPVESPFPDNTIPAESHGGVAPQIRRATPVYPIAPQNPAPPAPPPITAAPAGINDTARFLAGLPVSVDSPLAPLTATAAWQQHAGYFDKAWAKLQVRQLAPIGAWETNYLPQANEPIPVAYYMFSGPDLLYAQQFFPNAQTFLLAGTEPIGPLPDVLRFAGPTLDPVLQNLEKSLNSVLSFSFFITKDMKSDLAREELKGTLPIFYVFLARAGKTINDITFLALDKSGQPQVSTALSTAKPKALTPGVRITFTGTPDTPPQTLYYFTTDLSDDGIRSQPGFLKFCEHEGVGDSLLKSASYLMFEQGFVRVREFLLSHSKVIVQDDSGIPIAAFDPTKWDLRFFGAYAGPIDLFKQYFQPQLQLLYQQRNVAPLEFGIGYRWSPKQSSVIVAQRKMAESQSAPGAQ